MASTSVRFTTCWEGRQMSKGAREGAEDVRRGAGRGVRCQNEGAEDVQRGAGRGVRCDLLAAAALHLSEALEGFGQIARDKVLLDDPLHLSPADLVSAI